jgi:hypothetical protein
MKPQAAAGRPSHEQAGRRSGLVPASGRVAAACLLLCAGAVGARGQDLPPPSFEHEVKASFVYTVAKFVDWPEGAFADSAAPFVFVVLGDEPFQDSLLRTVAGRSVGGHPIEVVGVKDAKDLVACQVLFVGRSETSRVDELVERLRGASVLTVSESDRFAQSGGVLRLALEENMVRFEINVDAAERAHLQISSKILKLGKVVRDRKHVLGAP